jgi:hypothetical protein
MGGRKGPQILSLARGAECSRAGFVFNIICSALPYFHRTPEGIFGFNIFSVRCGHTITVLVSKKACTCVIFDLYPLCISVINI